jgi:dTDP-4-dehydrorhamnose 3,5-epimerase
MTLEPLSIEGAFLVHANRKEDRRGWLWKTFQDEAFERMGLNFICRETFYSASFTNVLRGLHFQGPQPGAAKLITCIKGSILDVILDIRASSKTYGKTLALNLDEKNSISIYVPKGCAHGFYVIKGPALLSYQTDFPYDQSVDCGIRWDSIPFSWPILNGRTPILSGRDRSLPAWDNFETPFF